MVNLHHKLKTLTLLLSQNIFLLSVNGFWGKKSATTPFLIYYLSYAKGHSCNEVDSFPLLMPNSRLCDKDGQESWLSITQSKVKYAPCQTVISRQLLSLTSVISTLYYGDVSILSCNCVCVCVCIYIAIYWLFWGKNKNMFTLCCKIPAQQP